MKKTMFSIIILLMISFVLPDAKAESRNTLNAGLLKELSSEMHANSNRLKKKKLKKIVRKAGKAYRIIKPDKENKQKSRKIQRTTRRIINIF